MVKYESLRINMFRITHRGKSINFPVTVFTKIGMMSYYLEYTSERRYNVRPKKHVDVNRILIYTFIYKLFYPC